MAVNDPANEQPQQPQPQVVVIDPQASIRMEQAAYAEAVMKAEREQKDETVEGGRYRVNGVWVNANGEKHKDQKSE